MVKTDSPTENIGPRRERLIKNGLIIISFAFLFYWILFILTPNLNSSSKTKEEVQSLKVMMITLDDYIKKEKEKQSAIDNSIKLVNQQIEKIDSSISKIKNQKIIIREYYHEKINSVDNFSDDEIDSFISNRYGNQ